MNIFYNKFKISNSWILLLGNGLTTLFNFVFFSLISHHLPIDSYGYCREIFLFANLFVTISVAGFAQTINYFLNHYKEETHRLNLIGQVRILIIIIQLLIALAIVVAYNLNFAFFNIVNLTDLILFLVYCFFTSITLIDINLSIVYSKNKSIILSNLLLILFKVILVYYFIQLDISLTQILFISALIQILVYLSNQFILKSHYWGTIDFNKIFQKNIIKELTSYTIPLAISVLIGFLTSNSDRFLLNIFNANAEKFAILSNVSFEVPFIANIYTSFFTIALPYLVDAYNKKNISFFLENRKAYIKNVSLLIFPIVLAFIFWHSQFILLAFGPKYVQFSYLFAIYSLISLMRVCSHVDVLLATNNTKFISYIQIAEFIIRVIISYILYQRYNIDGFIYAAVITNVLYVLITNYMNAKVLNVSIVEIFPYKYLISKLIFFILLGFFCRKIISTFLPMWQFEIFIYIIMAVFYIIWSYKNQKFKNNLILTSADK